MRVYFHAVHARGRAHTAVVPSGSMADLRRFDVPAEDATIAPNEWSRQGNLQVFFDNSVLRGRQTQAVEVSLPPRDAPASMLKGTGLNFSTVNEKTIAISPMLRPTTR